MEKRFIQKTTKAEAMERMEDMKQLENETIECWEDRIQRMAMEAGLKRTEMAIVKVFIKELRNKETKKAAARISDRPWEDVVKRARDKDREAKNMTGIVSQRVAGVVAPITPIGIDISEIEKTIKRLLQEGVISKGPAEKEKEECKKCGRTNHSTEMCGKLKCFNCGQFRHRITEYRRQRSERGRPRGRKTYNKRERTLPRNYRGKRPRKNDHRNEKKE